jgi:hypothetical protein
MNPNARATPGYGFMTRGCTSIGMMTQPPSIIVAPASALMSGTTFVKLSLFFWIEIRGESSRGENQRWIMRVRSQEQGGIVHQLSEAFTGRSSRGGMERRRAWVAWRNSHSLRPPVSVWKMYSQDGFGPNNSTCWPVKKGQWSKTYLVVWIW